MEKFGSVPKLAGHWLDPLSTSCHLKYGWKFTSGWWRLLITLPLSSHKWNYKNNKFDPSPISLITFNEDEDYIQ